MLAVTVPVLCSSSRFPENSTSRIFQESLALRDGILIPCRGVQPPEPLWPGASGDQKRDRNDDGLELPVLT